MLLLFLPFDLFETPYVMVKQSPFQYPVRISITDFSLIALRPFSHSPVKPAAWFRISKSSVFFVFVFFSSQKKSGLPRKIIIKKTVGVFSVCALLRWTTDKQKIQTIR